MLTADIQNAVCLSGVLGKSRHGILKVLTPEWTSWSCGQLRHSNLYYI